MTYSVVWFLCHHTTLHSLNIGMIKIITKQSARDSRNLWLLSMLCDLNTVGWGGKAQLWSWPLTKIRVKGYCLVLNPMPWSKYPFFIEPITIKFQKTFFQPVSTENLLFTRAWSKPPSHERKADNSVLVYLCVRLNTSFTISDARLQNKQQKI